MSRRLTRWWVTAACLPTFRTWIKTTSLTSGSSCWSLNALSSTTSRCSTRFIRWNPARLTGMIFNRGLMNGWQAGTCPLLWSRISGRARCIMTRCSGRFYGRNPSLWMGCLPWIESCLGLNISPIRLVLGLSYLFMIAWGRLFAMGLALILSFTFTRFLIFGAFIRLIEPLEVGLVSLLVSFLTLLSSFQYFEGSSRCLWYGFGCLKIHCIFIVFSFDWAFKGHLCWLRIVSDHFSHSYQNYLLGLFSMILLSKF